MGKQSRHKTHKSFRTRRTGNANLSASTEKTDVAAKIPIGGGRNPNPNLTQTLTLTLNIHHIQGNATADAPENAEEERSEEVSEEGAWRYRGVCVEGAWRTPWRARGGTRSKIQVLVLLLALALALNTLHLNLIPGVQCPEGDG